jgi:hypothetical protein
MKTAHLEKLDEDMKKLAYKPMKIEIIKENK